MGVVPGRVRVRVVPAGLGAVLERAVGRFLGGAGRLLALAVDGLLVDLVVRLRWSHAVDAGRLHGTGHVVDGGAAHHAGVQGLRRSHLRRNNYTGAGQHRGGRRFGVHRLAAVQVGPGQRWRLGVHGARRVNGFGDVLDVQAVVACAGNS